MQITEETNLESPNDSQFKNNEFKSETDDIIELTEMIDGLGRPSEVHNKPENELDSKPEYKPENIKKSETSSQRSNKKMGTENSNGILSGSNKLTEVSIKITESNFNILKFFANAQGKNEPGDLLEEMIEKITEGAKEKLTAAAQNIDLFATQNRIVSRRK